MVVRYEQKVGRTARANWFSDPTASAAMKKAATVSRAKTVKPAEAKTVKSYWSWSFDNGRMKFGEC